MTVLVVETGGSTETAAIACCVLAGRLDVARCADTDLEALLDRAPLRGVDLVVVACDGDADAGHRACRSVRAVTSTPLAMLASSRREADELLAFARGCDDYITTSSSPEIIRARLEVLATRGGCRHEQVVDFGSLRVDPSLRVASVDGIPIALTRIEFDLLHALVTGQRRVVSRRELLEVGWGACPPTNHVLDVHLSRLRRKVLQAGGPKIGEPVPGVGYRVGSPDGSRSGAGPTPSTPETVANLAHLRRTSISAASPAHRAASA